MSSIPVSAAQFSECQCSHVSVADSVTSLTSATVLLGALSVRIEHTICSWGLKHSSLGSPQLVLSFHSGFHPTARSSLTSYTYHLIPPSLSLLDNSAGFFVSHLTSPNIFCVFLFEI